MKGWGEKGKGLRQERDEKGEVETTPSPTLMPSEYVRGAGGAFDARKMGLSSKTFDSALSSMLNDEPGSEPQPLAFGSQFYDRFARDAKPPAKKAASRASQRHRPPATVTSSLTSKGGDRHKAAAALDHSGKLTTSWGPEAKVGLAHTFFLTEGGSNIVLQLRGITNRKNCILRV